MVDEGKRFRAPGEQPVCRFREAPAGGLDHLGGGIDTRNRPACRGEGGAQPARSHASIERIARAFSGERQDRLKARSQRVAIGRIGVVGIVVTDGARAEEGRALDACPAHASTRRTALRFGSLSAKNDSKTSST